MEAPAANASHSVDGTVKAIPSGAEEIRTLQMLALSQSDLIQGRCYLPIRTEKHMRCGEQHSKGHTECS